MNLRAERRTRQGASAGGRRAKAYRPPGLAVRCGSYDAADPASSGVSDRFRARGAHRWAVDPRTGANKRSSGLPGKQRDAPCRLDRPSPKLRRETALRRALSALVPPAQYQGRRANNGQTCAFQRRSPAAENGSKSRLEQRREPGKRLLCAPGDQVDGSECRTLARRKGSHPRRPKSCGDAPCQHRRPAPPRDARRVLGEAAVGALHPGARRWAMAARHRRAGGQGRQAVEFASFGGAAVRLRVGRLA